MAKKIKLIEPSEDVLKYISRIKGAVEADGYARHMLWQEIHKDPEHTWKECLSGYGCLVGRYNKRPVMLSLLVDEIDGHPVLFYYATSQLVDYALVDEWLKTYLPKSCYTEHGHRNRADAMNFYNVVNSLK